MQRASYLSILGLAWDCGAVTTGPVTVPLVLSLGIGIAASAGKGDSSLSGFGVVTIFFSNYCSFSLSYLCITKSAY